LFLTGATYLHAYYCFSGVAPKKNPAQHLGLVQSRHHNFST